MLKIKNIKNAIAGMQILAILIFAGGIIAQGTVSYAAAPGAEQPGGTPPMVPMVGVGLGILVLLLIKAGRLGGTLLASAFFPQSVTRAQTSIASWPVRLFFLGLANSLAVLIVVSALLSRSKSAPILVLIALAILFFFMIIGLLGMAGFYGWIGRRLNTPAIEEGAEILRGGIVWEVATLIPIFGLVAEIVAFPIALGAGTLVLCSRRDKPNRDEAIENASSSSENTGSEDIP